MKKIKIRNNRIIMIIGACFIVLLIFVIAAVTDSQGESKAIYGSRLDGIDKVEITKSKIKKINENVKSLGKVKTIKTYVFGKIINSEIKVSSDATRDEAKALAPKILEVLKEDEKKFYDVQVFIDKDDDGTFPIIGYCHHNKNEFTWTLDR